MLSLGCRGHAFLVTLASTYLGGSRDEDRSDYRPGLQWPQETPHLRRSHGELAVKAWCILMGGHTHKALSAMIVPLELSTTVVPAALWRQTSSVACRLTALSVQFDRESRMPSLHVPSHAMCRCVQHVNFLHRWLQYFCLMGRIAHGPTARSATRMSAKHRQKGQSRQKKLALVTPKRLPSAVEACSSVSLCIMGKDILIVSLADFENRKQDIAQQLLAASKVSGKSLARKESKKRMLYMRGRARTSRPDIGHRFFPCERPWR